MKEKVHLVDGIFQNCTGMKKLKMPISLGTVYVGSYSSSAVFNGVVNLQQIDFTKGTGIGYDYNSNKYSPWYYSRENEPTITLEERNNSNRKLYVLFMYRNKKYVFTEHCNNNRFICF